MVLHCRMFSFPFFIDLIIVLYYVVKSINLLINVFQIYLFYLAIFNTVSEYIRSSERKESRLPSRRRWSVSCWQNDKTSDSEWPVSRYGENAAQKNSAPGTQRCVRLSNKNWKNSYYPLWKIIARAWNVIDHIIAWRRMAIIIYTSTGTPLRHPKASALFRLCRAFHHGGRLCAYAYPHANFYAADLALRTWTPKWTFIVMNKRGDWWRRDGYPCLVLYLANLRSKQGANWTFVPFFEMARTREWLNWANTSREIIPLFLISASFFSFPLLLFFFTSAKKSRFAGVLCGVCGGTIARKEVGATLLHGLAKGSAGP